MKTNWTEDELKAYLLIYCANADFTESKVEIDFIKSKILSSNFDKIHREFNKDNDYQSIQKIQSTIERLGYSRDKKDELLVEIKEIFLSDFKYDTLEKNLLRGLNHIFA
jgi:hypothetical protein